VNGKIIHPRTLGASDFKKGKKKQLPKSAVSLIMPGKHRYLMPLDNEMRKQILPLAKPYPKRASSETRDTPSDQLGKAGARPSDALPL
jgi:hypothetical protein